MNQKLFQQAVEFSKAAYSDEIEKYPYELIESPETDTQVFIIKYSADVLFVVYRGTERNFRDLYTDLKFFRKCVPFAGMRKNTHIRGHTGFINAYHSVKNYVHVKIHINSTPVVIHCGHSLGGALAQWSVLDCGYNFRNIEHVGVTFGQPAIGNLALNRSFQKRVKRFYRFANRLDPVTWLPVTSLHATKKIQLKTWGHDVDKYVCGVEKWTY